ncbi:unnamed protein product [Sympodiomycopsis kandeliae]
MTTQPKTLPSLYRLVLRTSQSTFQGDQKMITAWRSYVRQKLPEQLAAKGVNSQQPLSDDFVNEWLDVVKMLRMNVVQGVRETDDDAYRLRFTSDTELGDNESIKAGRDKQLADLKASKGSLGCGGAAKSTAASSSARSFSSLVSSSPSSSSSSSGLRAFSTSARMLDPRETSKLKPIAERHVPHPPPHFPNTAILADGSSIRLTTTLPRGLTQLTRDPTNHPLWNPLADKKSSGGDDEAGRMGRFRKRFGGIEDGGPAESPRGRNARISARTSQPGSGVGSATSAASKPSDNQKQQKEQSKPSKPSSASSSSSSPAPQTSAAKGGSPQQPSPSAKSRAMFDLDDLDWMSGGREARAGQPQAKNLKKKK